MIITRAKSKGTHNDHRTLQKHGGMAPATLSIEGNVYGISERTRYRNNI